MRKNQGISWGPLHQQAFDSMKEKLCTAHVIAYPNFNMPLTAENNLLVSEGVYYFAISFMEKSLQVMHS